MQFGLMFFASGADTLGGDKYRLIIESARFADQHGFASVWVPERHFTELGCLYPNPAVLHAALARETERIALRAGSVVLPLHHPVRVAEEWAVVDNLSGGRIGISFASGWNPDDFAFFPEKYLDRHQEMYTGIETVQKLWQGESIPVTSGNGRRVDIRVYPKPVQPELPTWVTAAGNPQTFAKAGEIGANLLTHVFDQGVEQLAEKIQLYRQARARHGHIPDAGQVTMMLHTFVGAEVHTVREQARAPYCQYLKSNASLLQGLAQSRGQEVDLAALSPRDVDEFVNFLFDRFASSRGLIGTPETCLDLLSQLDRIGVNEVACLLDFGPPVDQILENLPYLYQLKERYGTWAEANPVFTPPSYDTDSGRTQTSNSQELLHAVALAPPSARDHTLPAIKARCANTMAGAEFYARLQVYGVQLKDSFQGIAQLWQRPGEALGHVQLVKALGATASAYEIHPAFLDACFQVFLATLPLEALSTAHGALYLPVGLRGLRVYRPIPPQVWSHAVLRFEMGERTDAFEGDIRLLDADGNMVAQILGLRLQHTASSALDGTQHNLEDQFYAMHWEPKRLEETALAPDRPGRWLIFADSGGMGHKLAAHLTAQGETCITVILGEAYRILEPGKFGVNPACPEEIRQLMQDTLSDPASSVWRGVIYLWALDVIPVEETTRTTLETDLTLSVAAPLYVIQALTEIERAEPPRVWFVTRGAQPVGATSEPLAVAQAPLWGLGRTFSLEFPHLWGGLVDLDFEPPALSDRMTSSEQHQEQALRQLVNAIWRLHREDQVAFRQGERYVARLRRSQVALTQEPPLPLRADATYLIPGGLGTLGLRVAQWMVERGARHLVLVGRRGVSETALDSIQLLKQAGAQVLAVQADVSDQEEIARVLEDIDASWPPLRGIIHMAGVTGHQAIPELDLQAFTAMLQPKMMGAWILHQLTQGMNLDFFICFSSVASLWGSLGQSHYAAANHFLDTLAHYRRHLGLPALTVNWGSWSGGGMASQSAEVQAWLLQRGVGELEPAQALRALEYLLGANIVQHTIANVDWSKFKGLYEARSQRPLLEYIEAASPAAMGQPSSQCAEILQQLAETPGAERPERILGYLRERVAKALGTSVSHLDVEQPLNQMGLDSLMAVGLRKQVQSDLGIDIPIIKFLSGFNITNLIGEVLEQLETVITPRQDARPSGQTGQDIQPEEAAQILANLEQLGDEEVDQLLMTMLSESERQP